MNIARKLQLSSLLFILPLAGFCQNEAVVNNASYFSNALFLTLLVTIILLAVLIVALSSAFKNIADSDYLANKFRKDNNQNINPSKTLITIGFILLSATLFSQETKSAIVINNGRIGGIDYFTFYFMLVIVLLELIILSLMFYQFNFLIRNKTVVTSAPKKESKLLKNLVGSVAIEEENSILLEHDYDGIKELDNDLPPWWKYGFYLTIAVSVIYLLHFHVLKTGNLQNKEYENDMAQAKLDIDEYMKNSANNVDENTVKLLTEQSDITTGKDIFIANCAACHGKLGEGTVGPNLTDEYWLHGGSIQDVFKSIKYGWVEKGMKSWKEDLSPMQIAQITSFIKTLNGTHPTNAKAAQGDVYIDESALPNDTTITKKDTLLTLDSVIIAKN